MLQKVVFKWPNILIQKLIKFKRPMNVVICHHYIKFIKKLRIVIDAEFGTGEKSSSVAAMNANNIWYSDQKQISHFPQNGWWHFLD